MKYSLIIHGGAGFLNGVDPVKETQFKQAMHRVTEAGAAILKSGGSALDAVTACVVLLEDDPLFNAGKGSVLTHHGTVEMDAAVMDGVEMNAGAVAGVSRIKNPVQLARTVMEKSEHVFLIGKGAEEFAQLYGVATEQEEYFIIPERTAQLAKAKQQGKTVLDHSTFKEDKKFGTVGAVAVDKGGNLAAATSTGGIVNKKFGRVGDSSLIGCGTWAENGVCAVSTTGFGEQFIRTALAKEAAALVRLKKYKAQKAADKAIAYLVDRVNGLGGIIIVDAKGGIGYAHSTPGLVRGYVTEGSEIQTAVME